VAREGCGGRKKILAFVTEGERAKAIFDELGIDGTALAPARLTPHQVDWCTRLASMPTSTPRWPD
jgi:hypothetical protein